MISLRKLIDATGVAAGVPAKPGGEKSASEEMAVETSGRSLSASLPPAGSAITAQNSAINPFDLLSAYLAAIAAIGKNGERAVPALGDMISSMLAPVVESLMHSASPETLGNSRRAVETQLSLWADKATQNRKEDEKTFKQLLSIAADAAESTGARDEKYSLEISGLSDRLRAVAGLATLPAMRRSINENATALSACVKRMAEDGRESVRKLTSEIAEYQARLQVSERRALVDPLTGLGNRLGFENRLESRIAGGRPFSLLIVDLNNFKSANDTYGHLAGDELLCQFAGEFKAQFRPEDMVARWGGDEFVAIVEGPAKEGNIRSDRVRHWTLGDYKIVIDNQTMTIRIDAAIGVVEWNGIETGEELFARADREMYRAKDGARELVKA